MTQVLKVARASDVVQDNGSAALKFIWAADAAPVLDGHCLVKWLIGSGSLVVVYGESNSGKTFFVIDLALKIASGQQWRGRTVQRSLVIYIAGEGTDGIKNRVAAYKQRGLIDAGIPLAIVQRAVDLLRPEGDIEKLKELVRQTESEAGEKCRLIVVDTLARAMAGGDENSAEDMSSLIGNADQLRQTTGAAVLLIHHAGKDSSKGARGHSSLRCAVDTEILVESQSEIRTATIVKQRDLPCGDVFAFELEQVVLGHDVEQEPVSSCVVKYVESPPKRRQALTGKWQKALLKALESRQRDSQQILAWTVPELREISREAGASKSSAYDAANSLAGNSAFLIPTIGGVKLAYAP